MNDTHTSDNDGKNHPVDGMAQLDPADTPAAAEQYAADLAAELEQVGETVADPVQLQADLGDGGSNDQETDS